MALFARARSVLRLRVSACGLRHCTSSVLLQELPQAENAASPKRKKKQGIPKEVALYREHMSNRRLIRVLRADSSLSALLVAENAGKLEKLTAVIKEHVEQKDVGSILSWNPRLMEMEPDEVSARIKSFKTIQGLEGEILAKFLRRREGVLSSGTYENLMGKIKYYQSLGIPSNYILRQLLNYGFLQLSLEQDIKPKLEFFVKAGIQGSRLGAALHYRQFTRDMKIEDLEKAGANFERLGLGYKNLLRVVAWNHKVLLDGNLEKVEQMVTEKGLKSGTPAFAKAFMTFLHVREESYKGLVEELKKFGISEADAVRMFEKVPSLASYSSAGVEKKMRFLTQEMGISVKEVLDKPWLLQASIEKKAAPRLKFLEFLRSHGLLNRDYSPSTILNDSEASFQKRMQHTEVYSAIRAGDAAALEAAAASALGAASAAASEAAAASSDAGAASSEAGAASSEVGAASSEVGAAYELAASSATAAARAAASDRVSV